MIVALGRRFAGYVLYLHDGKPASRHNWSDRDVRREGERPPTIGEVTVQYQFDIDGSHPGAGRTGTLLVNGESGPLAQVSETPGQIERDPLRSVAGSLVPVGRRRKITMLTTNTHVGKPSPSGSTTSGKMNIAPAIM